MHTLEVSSHATVVRHDAQRELKRLLHGDPAEQDLLGLLTAAGGGLSGEDLAELTDRADWEVQEQLAAVSARTFGTRSGSWLPAVQVYVLGHEELQQQAAIFLGRRRLESLRRRLHEWADGYRRDGWPPETPEYLFRGYFRLLRDTGDLDRMTACAVDNRRHDRMLDISGGDTAALVEIATVQELISGGENADLALMGRLAFHHLYLTQRNAALPIEAVTVWTLLDNVPRAEAIVRSMADLDRREDAQAALAATLAGTGDVTRAETVARSLPTPHRAASALADLAEVVAAAGDVDRAEAIRRRSRPSATTLARHPDPSSSRGPASAVSTGQRTGDSCSAHREQDGQRRRTKSLQAAPATPQGGGAPYAAGHRRPPPTRHALSCSREECVALSEKAHVSVRFRLV